MSLTVNTIQWLRVLKHCLLLPVHLSPQKQPLQLNLTQGIHKQFLRSFSHDAHTRPLCPGLFRVVRHGMIRRAEKSALQYSFNQVKCKECYLFKIMQLEELSFDFSFCDLSFFFFFFALLNWTLGQITMNSEAYEKRSELH